MPFPHLSSFQLDLKSSNNLATMTSLLSVASRSFSGKVRHLRFFNAFIKERSMYYVCENMVKPLTAPFKVSFVELVGPVDIQWFISHSWQMPVRHFSDSIFKHAQSYQTSWRESAYWILGRQIFAVWRWHEGSRMFKVYLSNYIHGKATERTRHHSKVQVNTKLPNGKGEGEGCVFEANVQN